jgi:hypothetical protein
MPEIGEAYTEEEFYTLAITLLEEHRALLEAVNAEIVGLRADIEHIHSAHWHQANASVPKAAVLVNEYMGGEDLDGNGLVYGRDFHIAPDCPDRPPMLESLPSAGRPLSWDEYLGSL